MRVRICRKKTRQAKAQLELTLASGVSDNEKDLFKYVNRNRRSMENIRLILEEDGHLTSKDEKKAETFNAFFALFFSS